MIKKENILTLQEYKKMFPNLKITQKRIYNIRKSFKEFIERVDT